MNKKTHRISIFIFGWVILSLLLFQGCSGSGQSSGLSPTLTALSLKIASTASVSDQAKGSSETLVTAQAKATTTSQTIFATQTTQAGTVDQVQLQTATVAAPIVAELPQYGLDASSGRVGWLHNPLKLDLTAYHDFTYGNDFMGTTAKNFVLAADITWDTQYGGSGCGFMFRSNGDKNKPNQYMVIATRFSNGRVIFMAVADGDVANLKDFYPKDFDRSFSAQNGSTNRLAIVARGNLIDIYTNLVKIGTVDTTQPPKQPVLPTAPQPPLDKKDQNALNRYQALKDEYDQVIKQAQSQYQDALKNYQTKKAIFTDGFLAMLALSESGHTVCNFDKAWLWLLEP